MYRYIKLIKTPKSYNAEAILFQRTMMPPDSTTYENKGKQNKGIFPHPYSRQKQRRKFY